MYIFIQPLIFQGTLEFLLLWAIVDNVAMNVGVIISVQAPAFNYFGQYTQKWNC